jgi:hypothetical protein
MSTSQRSNRYWVPVLLFVLLAAVLLTIQWGANAHKVLHESGDFAANSVQILDAKRLRLLYGNYSRIGTHHPGPAILYMLAAGEWLFHDVLRIAPSPFSGQLLAICFYTAGWFTLLFTVIRRSTGGALPALAYTLVFAGVIGYFDPQVYLGAWFPDLYVLPFAVMLAAIARLAWGHVDSLRALAVSSGFLINGHVSFIPMLGVILIVMLAANLAATLRTPERRILAPRFLRAHVREILVAVGILFLFFVPLLIATITEYPGPLYDYIRFGGGNQPHPLREAFDFVAFFWKPGHAWIWGLALALLLLTGLRASSRDALRDGRGIGIALVGASIALLVYAKFGIDHLELTYVGLFYYAVPAHAAALLALYVIQAIQAIRSDAGKWVAGVAAVAGAAGILFGANKMIYYDFSYDIPGTQALYEQLIKVPGSGRIVLDVDPDPEAWEYAWGDVVAIQLHALRQGQDLVCINERWHILFTRPAQCRPEELANPRRFLVRAMRMQGMTLEQPDIAGQGLLMFRHGRTLTPAVYTTVAQQPDYFRQAMGKGWSKMEGDFAWSDGPVAELNLPANPERRMLSLDLGVFLADRTQRQHFDVVANGNVIGGGDFEFIERRRQFAFDLGPEAAAPQHVEIRIAHPISPQEIGWSVDTRRLGVSLYGIREK